MKKFNFVLIAILTAGVVACSVDPDLPFDLEGSLESNGAFLRINSVASGAFDLVDLSSAAYVMDVEYFDRENGGLMQNIEFTASYTNFFLDPADRVDIPESNPFLTLTPGDFTPNDKGNPATTVSVPFTAVINALGLSADAVGVEDVFTIRWVINLTDGRSFSGRNSSPDVTGGAFFNAPGQARVFTVQALREDEFVGTYRFTQREPGPVFGAWLFGEVFEAELSIDPDNTLNGRVFTKPSYPIFGGFGPPTIPISFARTATMARTVGAGAGCSSAGLAMGPPLGTDKLVEIDINDDSQFTLVMAENVNADCGGGPMDIVFDAVKVN